MSGTAASHEQVSNWHVSYGDPESLVSPQHAGLPYAVSSQNQPCLQIHGHESVACHTGGGGDGGGLENQLKGFHHEAGVAQPRAAGERARPVVRRAGLRTMTLSGNGGPEAVGVVGIESDRIVVVRRNEARAGRGADFSSPAVGEAHDPIDLQNDLRDFAVRQAHEEGECLQMAQLRGLKLQRFKEGVPSRLLPRRDECYAVSVS
eukprot:CAMPEP_0174716214 /NCGR_PEP_ID=MMETSP1094-20130205/23289_1 /TAXON_ID=156173 /ORGANISM="Chrysochromulina brevifilum, Strain UTEX LB 985" /LENGTH=204 /DNA_ID=CAMNT_0015915911 /DNA_START=311 /DNA_END=926 /DNA_ORIENTATION=-